MLVGELDDDVVLARARRHVGHGARAVLVVLAGDLRLGRTLDRERQSPRTRVLSDDGEMAGLPGHTVT